MRERLRDEIKIAMKAKDSARLGTLRLINDSIQKADMVTEAAGKGKVEGVDLTAVLARMIKQRRESIEQYTTHNRPELAAKEAAEITVVEEFLPKQLGEREVKAAIAAIIHETGAAGAKDMGKVMGVLKGRYAGQLDFGKASALVKDILK